MLKLLLFLKKIHLKMYRTKCLLQESGASNLVSGCWLEDLVRIFFGGGGIPPFLRSLDDVNTHCVSLKSHRW